MSITKLVLVSKTGGTSKSWWCCYSTTTPFQAWLINKHRANLMKLSILIIIAHNFKIKFASQKKYNWQSGITKRNNAISHGVWKAQKKSHSTLRAKRATFTLQVDKKFIKNAKNGPFWRVFGNLKFTVKHCYQIGQF